MTFRRALGIGAGFVALFAGILGTMVAYAALTLPDLGNIGQRTGTIKIVDRNGQVIAQIDHSSHDVTTLQPSQISNYLKCATIAAEDRNFYTEGAFDVPRVAKALFVDVIARRAQQGASTITQQLAKQAFFVGDTGTAEKSPLRKLREALIANEINGKYSKDEILTQYLNIIFYGENAYGIENASQRFFGVHAGDLDLARAALLAGLPQAPSDLDPYTNPALTWQRMHYVVQGMVTTCAANQDQLHVTVSQRDADSTDPLVGTADQQAAKQQAFLDALAKGRPQNLNSDAPHFTQYVLNQLPQLLADNPSALTDGDLVVTTTLDLNAQRLANQAVANGVKQLSSRGANNGALLMLDPSNGQILAMVGSAGFDNAQIAGQYNVVTGERRPGSSFKPYVFETGFRDGSFKPDTLFDDTAAQSAQLGGVQDFDRAYMGKLTAAKGLLLSRNIVAEAAGEKAGMQRVVDFATSLGISSTLQPNVSTAIGSSSVRMIDHASAYSAFANGGQKVAAFGILKIADGTGNVYVDNTNQGSLGQVMSAGEAASVTNILQYYAKQWGLNFNVPTAGKSGTTDGFVDAWYMTYTPSRVVSTWVGHTDGAKPGESPMNQVFGTDEGKAIAVPFVNSLKLPAQQFPVVADSLWDCYPPDAPIFHPQHCTNASPTASPSASASATASATPTATAVPTSVPTSTPAPTATAVPTPCPTPTPAKSPTPVPSPSPTPITC